MNKKIICFIAQFPPPINGLSKAVSTLYNSELKNKFEFEKIDITNNLKFIKNLSLIKKSNADLFYFTISQTKYGNLRDLIILQFLIAQKKKCVIHLHGGYYRKLVDNDLPNWQKDLNYKLIRNLEGVIVLSNSLKYIFKRMISKNKIYVVKNCIEDTLLLTDTEVSKKLNTLKEKQVIHILYLSNFIQTKGYQIVLEIAKLEKENVSLGNKPRFYFDFAGEFFKNSDKLFFEEYIRKYKLEKFVTYHGIVDGEQKRELLKNCNIFILLTRYPKEGQPISILEAMGNAMTIVTTNHAGIPDIVQDGINGIVSKNENDIKTIYQSMYHFTNTELAIISDRNRKYCREFFSQIQYIESMKDIFESL